VEGVFLVVAQGRLKLRGERRWRYPLQGGEAGEDLLVLGRETDGDPVTPQDEPVEDLEPRDADHFCLLALFRSGLGVEHGKDAGRFLVDEEEGVAPAEDAAAGHGLGDLLLGEFVGAAADLGAELEPV